MQYLFMKLAQYNEYLMSTVNTDGLVLEHQDIRSHSAEYVFLCFVVCKG